MNGLWEILREALPEIIGGLVVAAILALIGIAARRRVVKGTPSNQPASSPASPSHPEVSPVSPDTIPQTEEEKAELLDLKRRRLHELKKKEALMGVSTPPEVLIEIKRLEEEIRALEHESKCVRQEVRELKHVHKPEPSPTAIFLPGKERFERLREKLDRLNDVEFREMIVELLLPEEQTRLTAPVMNISRGTFLSDMEFWGRLDQVEQYLHKHFSERFSH